MASKSRTRRPAAKRPPARRPAPAGKRRPAARKPAARREPILTPRQIGDLLGLAVAGIGAFAAFVVWFSWDGAFLGHWLDGVLRGSVGRGAALVPPIAAVSAAVLFAHGTRPRLRSLAVGSALAAVAILVALSNDVTTLPAARLHGGVIGDTIHHGVSSLVGEAGVIVLVGFGLVAGLLLVTGASVAAVSERLRYEVVETAKAVRDAVPERAERVRPAEAPARAARPTRRIAAAAAPDEPPPWPELTPSWEHDEPVDAEPVEELPEAPPITLVAPPTDDRTLETTIPGSDTPYRLPDPEALVRSTPVARTQAAEERTAAQLLEALGHFGIEARLVGAVSGPRVTRYEIQLAPGTKVGKVSALRDDLAYALATTEIRILAPIPGKQAVGVEVPNANPNLVTLGDVYGQHPAGASPLSVWLGKDISGNNVSCDLAKMPHVLIAGTTGSGKSGCVNAMLVSILLNATPEQVRMILIDPKKVELNHYEAIPHLLTPVVTNVKQAAAALLNIVTEMERRYEMLGAARTRNIIEFNRARREAGRETIPYVLVVIDELADLMMVSPAEVEDAIIRLAQKSRAVGIHLVLATQRPSVDVITGMIKANVPSRIAFAVSSMTDSRVILDTGGAESLLGQGDMLYRPLGTSRMQRVQGAYVTEEEIGLVVEQCRDQGEPEFAESLLDLPEFVAREGDGRSEDDLDPDHDDLLDDAIRLVVNHETASVSLLQRRLRVGYTRAGRLIDMLERRGVISGYEGSKPRQVLITEADLPRLLAG
jgi:S-DNA-T family DNA segregation ATPase FtsK/SpoIIIE